MQINNIKNRTDASILEMLDPETLAGYTKNPGHSFSRKRKLPPEKLIDCLLYMGAGATGIELAKMFPGASEPSVSAFCQCRSQLSPEYFYDLFVHTNRCLFQAGGRPPKWIEIGIDGTGFSFCNYHEGDAAYDEWRTEKGRTSGKPIMSGKVVLAVDLKRKILLDAVIQPIHKTNEYAATGQLADRLHFPKGCRAIFTSDRGTHSWNTMAHVIHAGHYFVQRVKTSAFIKSFLSDMNLPQNSAFDQELTVHLVRSRTAEAREKAKGANTHYLCRNRQFDYLKFGSDDVFKMNLRLVSYQLPSGTYALVFTNLPKSSFSAAQIAEKYAHRWLQEVIHGLIKGALSLESFHARKPEYVMQEIYCRLRMFNVIMYAENEAERVLKAEQKQKSRDRKHSYAIDFTAAAIKTKQFLRDEITAEQLLESLTKRTHAVRKDRSHPVRGSTKRRTPIPLTHRAAF